MTYHSRVTETNSRKLQSQLHVQHAFDSLKKWSQKKQLEKQLENQGNKNIVKTCEIDYQQIVHATNILETVDHFKILGVTSMVSSDMT